MRRMTAAIAGTVMTALMIAALAFAAVPKKGGTYVGDIKSSPFSMHVTLVVAASGKGASFTYLCGTGRPPTTVRGIAIDKTGHFKFTSNPTGGQDWKMAGRFVTAKTAFVSLNSVSCGGSKGSTTMKLK